MKKYNGFTRGTTLISLLSLLSLLTTFWFFNLKANDTHFANMSCNQCHLTSTNEITAENAGKLIGTQERLCSKCHENAMKTSHPSGMVPSFKTSDEFPLDWKGELTCSSCHDVHNTFANYRRSMDTGKQYCFKCHQQSFFAKMLDNGSSLVHTFDEDYLPVEVQATLDAQSKKCLSCHQKQTKEFIVGLNSRGVVNHVSSSVSHPIGRSYDQAFKYGGYHPVSRLNSQIHLPDGKLGCLSCHQGYTSIHGQLVQATGGGSSLCFMCHDM